MGLLFSLLFSSLSLLLCIHRREKLLFYRYTHTHTLTSIRAVSFSLDSDIETTTTTTLIVMTTRTRRLVTSESLRKGRKKKRFSLWFKGFFFSFSLSLLPRRRRRRLVGARFKRLLTIVCSCLLSLSPHQKMNTIFFICIKKYIEQQEIR